MGTAVLSESFMAAVMTDVTQAGPGVAGALNGSKAKLYNNNFAVTSKTVLGDLTFNADANLAAFTEVWGTAYRRADGAIAIDGGLKEWQLALIANAETFYGLAITDSAGATLLMTYPFDAPLTLDDTIAAIVTVPQFALGGPDFGELTVIR